MSVVGLTLARAVRGLFICPINLRIRMSVTDGRPVLESLFHVYISRSGDVEQIWTVQSNDWSGLRAALGTTERSGADQTL